MNLNIKFGTDGWRDIIADDFTFKNVSIVSRAIGEFITHNYEKTLPLYIGYDSRFLSKEFANCAANEFIKQGIKIMLSDSVVPTPVVAYHAFKNKSAGAIQFTASHNPPKYCGLKYITNYGGPAPERITDEITKLINDCRDAPAGRLYNGQIIPLFNPRTEYFRHIGTLIDFQKIKNAKLKIIYDPLFGAGLNYLDHLIKEAGCEIYTIHNRHDPLFGGLLPEPREENLNDLKEAIISKQATIGLATDGDADRLGIMDEKGIFYSPNKIASMLVKHLIKNKKLTGNVVRTLSTTHLVDHLAKKYNLKVIETKVGFKWIAEEMLKTQVLIGLEESGGISILNHIPDKDAILAGMLITEMVAYENKPLNEIYLETLKDAEWKCINDRFDLYLDEKEKNSLIEYLQSKKINEINGLKVISVNTQEGAKYLFEDGSWFFARSSGTEPMARVYFEATSDKILEIMKSSVRKLIKECRKSV